MPPAAIDAQTGRLGYLPALDGLRGVAVALVVSFHFWAFPSGGWLGVELFFVLSGFLITTLLLEEHDSLGTIRLLAFYTRRARRLLPALLVLLAAYSAIDVARGGQALGVVARFGLYGANVYEAFWPGAAGRLVGLNHLWSLAQEEQFYLLWPAALLAVKRVRNPAALLTILAAALMAYRAGLLVAGASEVRVFYAPDTNMSGLVLGSALAFQRRTGGVTVPPRTLPLAAAIATVIAFVDPPPGLQSAVSLP